MSKQKKFYSLFLIILLTFIFSTTQVLANLTFSQNSIIGTSASAIDLGPSNLLSLQTTSNGAIITGTGLFTVGGSLNIAGLASAGNQCLHVSATGLVSGTGSDCGSGGGTWGSITGTLSAQTDLQNALNAKQAILISGSNISTINGQSLLSGADIVISSSGVPYTGATGDVNLGTHNLTANQITVTGGGPSNITLQTAPVGNPSAGTISYWGDTTQKKLCTKDDAGVTTCMGGGGSMVYPGAGVPKSTGSVWDTSYAVGTGASNLVQLDSSSKLPAVDGSQLTNLPSGGGGLDPTDPSNMLIVDDFPPSAVNGSLGWTLTGVGQTSGQQASVAGHPSIRSLVTGATSGNWARFYLNTNANVPFYGIGSGSEFTSGWDIKNIVLLDNVSGISPLTNMQYLFSIATNGGGVLTGGTRGIGIVASTVDPAIAGCTWNIANWMYVAQAGAFTCVDSGVPVLSGTWYNLRMRSTTLGQVIFTVNGAASQTISTNIQAASATYPMGPSLESHTLTATAKIVWQDFWSFKGTGLTR